MALGKGRRIRSYRAAEVTRISPRELPAAEAGMTQDAIDRVWRSVEKLYGSRVHPAIGLCIRRHGTVVLDRSIGHARGNSGAPGRPTHVEIATPDTPYCIFSTSKAVTAMLIHLLDDRGALHIDDPVVEYIPEFGAHGKDGVTIAHVLTHRSGIPTIPGESVDLDLLADFDEIVARLCASRPVSAAGRRLAYHAITGGYILGEIVRRVTGLTIREFLAREILDPLKFRWMNYGVSEADLPRVAENAFTGPPLPGPISAAVTRALGLPLDEAVKVSNDPRYLRAIVPAGNVVSTSDEVSRFFQLLLNDGELDGHRVFEERTIRRVAARSAQLQLDFTLLAPVRYGLGLMLGSETVSPFGPHTSGAFGHLGFVNIFGWADRERDIACCLMTNGKPLLASHLIDLWGVLATISREFPRIRSH